MTRRTARRWTLACGLAASILVLAACGGAATTGSPDAPPTASDVIAANTPASPPDAEPTKVAGSESAADSAAGAGQRTPEVLAFTADTVDGVAFDAATLAGKPVVFWFWAPWCTICRAESGDVAKVAAEFADRVEFVGIAGLGPVEDMRAFVAETSTGGFTHLADADGSLWSRFGVIAQPSFVFVTADGQAEEFTGGLGEEDLRNVANQLLDS